MYNRLYSYFNKQFGFRKNNLMAMALIEVIDKILEGLDRSDIVAAVYLDRLELHKGSDTVDHTIRSHYITAKNCMTMAYVAMSINGLKAI
jgi:hypothetical protein